MAKIVFFDTEIDPTSKTVSDIGAINDSGQELHSKDVSAFLDFIANAEYLVGHNVLRHDLLYLEERIKKVNPDIRVIDTLDLSPLLFPHYPYHKLLKDDKILTEELNNPLNDAIKARDLFYNEKNDFYKLDPEFQSILFALIGDLPEFNAFFKYINFQQSPLSLEQSINTLFHGRICGNTDLEKIIQTHRAELAYCLALVNATDDYSITPRWLNYSRPELNQVMRVLRSQRCLTGCEYCDQENDAHAGLRRFFGYNSFRKFGDEPLQENAVRAALRYESLLTVFPTGGGKSITFQVPALMQGMQNKGLTVVISPLQSLMKDQVDNLEKAGITSAVTINGLQDPIERSKSIERVFEGQAHILYISPESLRSPSIERLILGRSINRFVIDEAHCFSSWGQDFRVDYLYIGDFIKNIQEKRQQEPIPVSCFTATAKPQVIDDICQYFQDKLQLKLKRFQSSESRKNLRYIVFEQEEESGKYAQLREILTEHQVPTIVYVSRTRRAEEIAERLTVDGFPAKPYHGKLDSKVKTENQDAFLEGRVMTMVATSAFGMGVDKKDIKTVVHYDISDSLENYVQEAGRAGRDENLEANCFILYNEEDLNKHFILQNQTRLTQKEINQVWRAIKGLTRTRATVSKSALEIAREAGWDETLKEVETQVKTAVAALEQAGYVKRKNNQASVFADSLHFKTAQDAIDIIESSSSFSEVDKGYAVRIVKSLISSKRKSALKDEDGESRVDYLADKLGIELSDVIRITTLLRKEKLLAEARDLSAFIGKSNTESKLINGIKQHAAILSHLLQLIEADVSEIRLKEMREDIVESNEIDVTVKQIRTIIHFLAIKHWIRFGYHGVDKNAVSIHVVESVSTLQRKANEILAVAPFIGKTLLERATASDSSLDPVLVDFSVNEIKESLQLSGDLEFQNVTREIVEDAIFYLTRIDALTIEGGFLVIYQRIMVERLESNYRVQYKADDYKGLEQFYQNKIQQVHIVGEYARKMVQDYKEAVQFVDDYFKLNYASFLNKYFPGRQHDIKNPITPRKFHQLFGTLSTSQLEIVKDGSKYISVLAGPGSGKTKVLVHKLAAASLMENLKHEQILMLTFSRSAVTEFKKRLYGLIGNAAAFIQIKTFHSYCFDLLGKVGDLEESNEIIQKAVLSIREDRVESNRLTKLLLLVDEAQDINHNEYELLRELANQNEGMRIILVGDDDQNIYEFRHSSSTHLEKFSKSENTSRHELLENFRSDKRIVRFANQFLSTIRHRLKHTPISASSKTEGDVSIIECKKGHLSAAISGVVIKAELSGSSGVLCQTNQEAAEIHSILTKQNINARLIQSNEDFRLYNLVELRAFVDKVNEGTEVVISRDQWSKSKRECKQLYQSSRWWEFLQKLWGDFEGANQKEYYVSDLLAFVNESKLEDFAYESSETILISTYHKAKGREFDNVFVTVGRLPQKDEEKRALYVAITRAKHKLVVMTNSDFLKPYSEGASYSLDNTQYAQTTELVYHLTLKDVKLGHFAPIQKQIDALMSGDALGVNEDGCKDQLGNFVVRFSEKFQQYIQKQLASGFKLKSTGKVNFIVWWKSDEEREVKVVLPEVIFSNIY